MIRVLVVDDSTFVRKAIRRVLKDDPDIEVVGEAEDGLKALEMIARLDPHVVTLDVKMPGLDGFSTLLEIMSQYPRPVLMLSAYTQDGSDLAARCLESGAVGYLDKSTYGTMDYHLLAAELKQRIRSASAGRLQQQQQRPQRVALAEPEPAAAAPPAIAALRRRAPRLVLIGASTGGPPVLQSILSDLPAELPSPILVVQHMPRGFTSSFAQRLDAVCRLPVAEATAGELLVPGRVLIAPAGRHLRVASAGGGRLIVQLSRTPSAAAHMPSIDETMASAAQAIGAEAIGILLTGMGSDGAEGLLALRLAGSQVIVQSPASCVAPGMPRAALERGGAERTLDPAQIAAVLRGLVD
jgi:two-component system, chemotaxis family, protein-glutamate methylesterase/glutaminase